MTLKNIKWDVKDPSLPKEIKLSDGVKYGDYEMIDNCLKGKYGHELIHCDMVDDEE